MAHIRKVTTNESWGSRLKGSFKSVLAGVVLAGVAVPVMWCNEGRAVTTARSLDEGAGLVVSISAERAEPEHNGALVHVSGRADTTETIRDLDFGVSAAALKLVRTVEMCQWDEVEKSETREKFGGGKETVKTYSYRKTWSSRPIDSGAFRSDSYENPRALPWPSRTMAAWRVTLGAFVLSQAQVDQISAAEALPVDANTAAMLPAGTGLRPVKGVYYRGKNPNDPQVGDVRVSYRIAAPRTVSIVARQAGQTFEPYQTKAGDTLLLLENGMVSADAMFKAAARENRVLTWVLRAVGTLLLFVGLLLVFRPIAVMGAVVPFVGRLLAAGLALFSFVAALALSLLTIATAWLFYRPLLSLGLAAIAFGALLLLRRSSRKGPNR